MEAFFCRAYDRAAYLLRPDAELNFPETDYATDDFILVRFHDVRHACPACMLNLSKLMLCRVDASKAYLKCHLLHASLSLKLHHNTFFAFFCDRSQATLVRLRSFCSRLRDSLSAGIWCPWHYAICTAASHLGSGTLQSDLDKKQGPAHKFPFRSSLQIVHLLVHATYCACRAQSE